MSHKYSSDGNYFAHWFYADYHFTLAALWSPFFVTSRDAGNRKSLYLDEVDEGWAGEVEGYNYVIISAGQWFFQPLYFYEKGRFVGCHKCSEGNITSFDVYYGYRKAFKTAFGTLLNLKSYKGATFLRTFSPAHFENADWNNGGTCSRTRPYTNQERQMDEYMWDMYLTQVEELRAVEDEGRKRGLGFGVLNTTEIMWLRPDGHPSKFGHSPHRNETVNDCVHWCLPGPIDTWNEFLSGCTWLPPCKSSSLLIPRPCLLPGQAIILEENKPGADFFLPFLFFLIALLFLLYVFPLHSRHSPD